MSSAERRQRHREELRARILEAALEIVSEQGLAALSIRAIAQRVEYSSASIYLYFGSKEALLEEVAREGFRRFDAYIHAAIASLPPGCEPLAELRTLGRAYVQFAVENTAYFRIMFDLPVAARVTAVEGRVYERDPRLRDGNWGRVTAAVQRLRPGASPAEAEQVAIAAWAMLHGLVTLYLSGQLQAVASDHQAFTELVAGCMAVIRQGLPTGAPVA